MKEWGEEEGRLQKLGVVKRVEPSQLGNGKSAPFSAERLPCLYCVCVDDVTAEQSAFIVQYLLDHDNPLGYTRTLGGAVWGSTGRVGGAHVRPGLGLGDGERVCVYSRG